jgi:hypothetical protein
MQINVIERLCAIEAFCGACLLLLCVLHALR